MDAAQTPNNTDILVRVLPTPNPNALKFVINRDVKRVGKATFTRPSEATGLKLASDLFEIEGVRQLHFFENVITVTFAEETDLDTLRLEVTSVIQRDMPIHNADFLMEEERKKADRSRLSPELQKIEEILDKTVRQYLQGDGGDIEVVALAGHVLEVRYQGACGTCPSSISGTLDAIQGILRDQFDPNLEVAIV
ncbi:MAG: NifU family protein [Bdellovibrionaceae bacterium]|nr:NifU family protein [Pseudobdellovibrionaceae bacterium]